MKIITSPLFRESAILERIEKTVTEKNLSPGRFIKLSLELEKLVPNGLFGQRIENVKKQLFERGVSIIFERAQDLGKLVHKGDLPSLAAKVDAMKNLLLSLEKMDRPDHGFIKCAKEFIEYASKMLKNEKWNDQMLTTLLTQLAESIEILQSNREQITPEQADFIMELFDIAELIHTKRELGGKFTEVLGQLPADKRKKILLNQDDLEQLKVVLVEIGHELAGIAFKRNQAEEWFKDLEQYIETPHLHLTDASMIQG